MAAPQTAWVDPPADDRIIKPQTGGLFLDSSNRVTAWTGFDPDQPILCYSYSRVETPGVNVGDPLVIVESWEVDTTKFDAHMAWSKHKGPVHPGQFRPIGVKLEQKTRELCTKYTGNLYYGIENKSTSDKPKIALATYKTSLRQHMISHGMYDVFLFEDPNDPTLKYDLFRNHSRATLDQVRQHWDHEVAAGRTDHYTNENLMYSGIYIRSTISSDLLQALYNDINATTNGPVTLIALLRLIYYDGYDSIEALKSELKSIELKKYSGENVIDCCVKIIEICERLDTAEA